MVGDRAKKSGEETLVTRATLPILIKEEKLWFSLRWGSWLYIYYLSLAYEAYQWHIWMMPISIERSHNFLHQTEGQTTWFVLSIQARDCKLDISRTRIRMTTRWRSMMMYRITTHNDPVRAKQALVMCTDSTNLHAAIFKAGVMPLIILRSVGRGTASLSFPCHGFD